MLEAYLKEFEKLNKYQKDAVIRKDKYTVLNAVVGSGKTTVLTHKVMYLHIMEGVPLEDMVVLTFTNKAANEIRDRICAFDDGIRERMKYFGTFHSVARTILANSYKLSEIGYTQDFEIIDSIEAGELLEGIIEGKKLKIKYRAKLLKRLEEYKRGKTLYGVMKNADDIQELMKLYREEKIEKNQMDFDDLIDNCIQLLEEPINPRWIIVDEFQDTDQRQLNMLTKMAGENTNIFVIGDPNQIIYSFRTGNQNIFDEFKKLYSPTEVTLPINYRSSRTIIEAAQALLNGSNIEGIMGYGTPIIIRKHFDSFNEALYIARKIEELHLTGIPYKSVGILYRRQAQGEVLSDVLIKNGIPFKIVFKKPLPFEEASEVGKAEEGVNLLTLHASKGLEFSHVFIIGVNMGNIPLATRREEEEEEVRLFFVGMTRAKLYLEMSYCIKPSLQGVSPYPSPYLSMLPQGLVKREEEGQSKSISELMDILRQDREKKLEEENRKTAIHPKYGSGKIVYEDESIIKVEFETYGEKEFSRMFCPLTIE